MTSAPTEPRAWLPAALVLAAVLALWIDLSPIHQFHNSDSLIPILMSLDRWTPFYWGQNRFGMLPPLLALPVQDPFANLLTQGALRLLSLVLAFFLLARTVVPRLWWPAVGVLTFGLFVLGQDLRQQNFFQMQPYFQAMALALAGALLLEGGWRRKTAGGALFALAFWVAPVALFWLVPLLGLRRVLGLGPPPAQDGKDNKGSQERHPMSLSSLLSLESLLPFGLAGAAFLGSLLASRLSRYNWATNLGLAPLAAWPRGWLALAEKGAELLGPWLLAGIGILLAAALVRRLLNPLPPAGEGAGVRAGLCLLGTAAVELLILGTTAWIHVNGFKVRFLSTVLLATATAGPALFLGFLLERRPAQWARAVNVLAVALLLPLMLWRFGLPSLATARAALAAGPGAQEAREIVADDCTHVLGNYWRVWTTVFQARVLGRVRGEERKVWGIAFRSTPTWDLWRRQDWSRARIAVLGSPRQAEWVRAFYRIPRFGDPRGPARCAAPPVVSFRGFRGVR